MSAALNRSEFRRFRLTRPNGRVGQRGLALLLPLSATRSNNTKSRAETVFFLPYHLSFSYRHCISLSR